MPKRMTELMERLVSLEQSLDELSTALGAGGSGFGNSEPLAPRLGATCEAPRDLSVPKSTGRPPNVKARSLWIVGPAGLVVFLLGVSFASGVAFTWSGSVSKTLSSPTGAWVAKPSTLCAENGLSFTVANTVTGTAGPDFLILGNQGQLALALGGFDIVVGGNGKDCIDGGPGGDVLKGLNGDDVILGGEGNDFLYGGAGDDVLDGGPGFDICVGGSGKDTIRNCEVIFQGIDPGGCEPVHGSDSFGANTDRHDDDCDPGCDTRHTENFSSGDTNHHDPGDDCDNKEDNNGTGAKNFAAPVDDGSTDGSADSPDDVDNPGGSKDDPTDADSDKAGDGEEADATVVKDGVAPSGESVGTGGKDSGTDESDDSETATPEPDGTPTPGHAPKPTLQPGMRDVISTGGGVAIYPK